METELIIKTPLGVDKISTPIAVVGYGVTGSAIFNLIESLGIDMAELCVYDEKDSPALRCAVFNEPTTMMEEFSPKTLIVSPGYPLKSKWIDDFVRAGGLVTTELEIAFSFITTERVICVTGSAGKSTSVALLESGLNRFSKNYFVGGNFGLPLATYVYKLRQQEIAKADWIVLELSSYQLERFRNLRATIGGIVSLTENHLERYLTKEEYYNTKLKMIYNCADFVVINRHGRELAAYFEEFKKFHPPSAKIEMSSPEQSDLIQLGIQKTRLIGRHNLENLAFAVRIALSAQWPESAIAGMLEFAGLSHRLENVGINNGVKFINDSKATTISGVELAVTTVMPTLNSGAVLHLLLGGRDKNLPWERLGSLRNAPAVKCYFFGECRRLVKSKTKLSGVEFVRLEQAAFAAFSQARPGDCVLLSPGGTSLDEFSNFEERGESFRRFFSQLEQQLVGS